MTAIEIVQEEARKLGKKICDESADFLLWEYTGFPYFWDIPNDGETPEQCLRKQVRKALKEQLT